MRGDKSLKNQLHLPSIFIFFLEELDDREEGVEWCTGDRGDTSSGRLTWDLLLGSSSQTLEGLLAQLWYEGNLLLTPVLL